MLEYIQCRNLIKITIFVVVTFKVVLLICVLRDFTVSTELPHNGITRGENVQIETRLQIQVGSIPKEANQKKVLKSTETEMVWFKQGTAQEKATETEMDQGTTQENQLQKQKLANLYAWPTPSSSAQQNASRNMMAVVNMTAQAVKLKLDLLREPVVKVLLPGGLIGTEEHANVTESSSDVYYSIKSTTKYHGVRLSLLLVTWLQTVNLLQVHLVSESDNDPWIHSLRTRGTTIITAPTCKHGHTQVSLCCKSGMEFQAYFQAKKKEGKHYRWFCHLDDDMYVNTAQLVKMLKSYDPFNEKVYLGHYPLSRPLSHKKKRRSFLKNSLKIRYGNLMSFPERKGDSYTYATGAAYCISSSLMDELEKYLSGHNFQTTCKKLDVGDDLAIGIIIVAVLGYNQTEVPAMMSEINNQARIDHRTLTEMITIGYHIKTTALNQLAKSNSIAVPGSPFTKQEDPTRLLMSQLQAKTCINNSMAGLRLSKRDVTVFTVACLMIVSTIVITTHLTNINSSEEITQTESDVLQLIFNPHAYDTTAKNDSLTAKVCHNKAKNQLKRAARANKNSTQYQHPASVYFSLLNESTVQISHKKTLGVAEHIDLPERNSDIFISMKTTAKKHKGRLPILLVTWLQTVAPFQVHILTDSDNDNWIQTLIDAGYSISVTTQCKAGHTWSSLCCKSGKEYQAYYLARRLMQRNYRWFCHIDDDIYVNIAQLVRLLKSYDPVKEKLYLGHFPASLWENKEIFQNDTKKLRIVGNFSDLRLKSDSFAYATGASYCISSSLMDQLEKYLSGHKFYATCKKLNKSDDLTVGIIIDAVLGYSVTEVPAMMSEVEDQTKIEPKTLAEMITVGYRRKTKTTLVNYQLNKNNRVIVPNSPFSEEEDPTGFLSFHCLLYPRTSWCIAKCAGQ